MKIKARINGGPERMGAVKKFEIVDGLPEAGELVDMSDPGYVWGEASEVVLDPEQGIADEDEHVYYTFWSVPEISTEDEDEAPQIRYFALKDGGSDE